MKVRKLRWYRKEEEMFVDCTLGSCTLALRHFGDRWCKYSPVNLSVHLSTREAFEKDYLEWKAQNEG